MRHLAETHDSLFHISPFHILLTLLFHISLFLEASLSRKRDGMYSEHAPLGCNMPSALLPATSPPPNIFYLIKSFDPKSC